MTLWGQETVLPALVRQGRGEKNDLLPRCTAWGNHGLLVHGASLRENGGLEALQDSCPSGVQVRYWEHAGGEPTVEQVDALREAAHDHGATWIAAVGGGSVLDLGKACAGLALAPQPTAAYHAAGPPETPALPFAAVPTTAGTGSEATKVAVLTNPLTGVKKALRRQEMLARLVILDADCLKGAPAESMRNAGFDALTQALESLMSTGATWFTTQLAGQGLALLAESLEAALADTGSEAAEQLLLGSFLTGMAFANSRLGVVHGLAHPLGARFSIPHGHVCGLCLPLALEFNREAAPKGLQTAKEALGGKDALAFVRALADRLTLDNPLQGKTISDAGPFIDEVLASGSTAHNPRPVSAEDVRFLVRALGLTING